jgi:hypothetical protein
VEQSDTCAATSRVYKAGLSVATAGITATFTIQGRDAYDNKRLFTFNNKVREFEWALMSDASLPPAGLSLQNSVVDGGEVAEDQGQQRCHQRAAADTRQANQQAHRKSRHYIRNSHKTSRKEARMVINSPLIPNNRVFICLYAYLIYANSLLRRRLVFVGC